MNQGVLEQRLGARSPRREARAAAAVVAALLAAWLSPAPAQAQEGGAVVLLQARPRGWEQLSAALERELGAPVRLGRLAPWPAEPDAQRLREAEAAYQKGVEHFLALKLDLAEREFLTAQDLYRASWEQAPTHEASLAGLARSGFYGAWASLERGDKRQARDKIGAILQELPAAEPDPNVFPPPFVEVVEDARKRARKGAKRHDLSLTTLPADAQCWHSAGQASRDPARGGCQLDLFGPATVWVGGPGLGLLRQALDPAQEDLAPLDLAAWPAGLGQPKQGHPLGADLLGALEAQGSPSLAVFASDASLLGRPGAVLWVQALPSGALTAAVVVDEAGLENPDALAQALAPASRTPALEVFAATGGGWLQDEALHDKVEEALSGQALGEDPTDNPQTPGPRVGLGAYLAAGAGIATEVTDPGLAPTPLVLWFDASLGLSERLDLGLAGRVQALNFSALAHPYARLRLGPVWVSGGAMLGEITHRILQTENRDASTSGWLGPALGLHAPLGWLSLGVQALAPVFPNKPTVHVDAVVGVHFDL